MDWGSLALDTVMEREIIQGKLIFTLTHFGDHCMHHLFPTIDHALLPDLEEIVIRTCKEFEVEFRQSRWWDLVVGQFEQLVRTEVNNIPVSQRKKMS